ncbi:hypothetical protein EDB89DRAFT_1962003 [Lactarius sanguifluus]|nr:hypothetical protein EDB89DRAFT_1962003 [Lactarius sanguifluus]
MNQNRIGRMIQIPEIATDHIKEIISYAAADAAPKDQIKFFHTISTDPSFRAPAEKMFEGFVLSWLYACPNAEPLRCFTTNQVDLEVPVCGKEQTTFFDSTNGLRSVNGDQLPLCLLPKDQNLATACAIVITDEFVITIQVILSHRHATKGGDLDVMKEVIPAHIRRDRWRHVFITNDYNRALSLRYQTLPEPPTNTLIYSGVFDIFRSGVTRKHVEMFNEEITIHLSATPLRE